MVLRAIVALLLVTSFAAPAAAATIVGTKWEPNGAASSFNPATPPGTPGAATWSLMPAGVGVSLGDPGVHPNNAVSVSIVGLTGLPDVGGVPYEIWAINSALDQWAAVSGFTNLGQVADGPSIEPSCLGGLFNGCVDVGSIRIGAYPFVLANGVTLILAHAYAPNTTALTPPFGSIGGDAHFNIENALLNWVDDPNDVFDSNAGDIAYDFYTVVLHEIGHALGLDHATNNNSVMTTYSNRGGALRTLSADDIAGIQAIYGAEQTQAEVPEPTTLLMLGFGLAWLSRRRTRKTRAISAAARRSRGE
jgi:hypothetical protein